MKDLYLSLLVLLVVGVHGEVVIVATEKGLVEADEASERSILRYENATAVSGHRTVALAADPLDSKVFYSLPLLTPDGRMITRLKHVNVWQGVSPNPQPVSLSLEDTSVGHIRGLAYNDKTKTLYWTDMLGHSIWQCAPHDGCQHPTALMRLPEGKEPAAIAVDPCRGHLYWTDNNHTSPSINRIRIQRKKSSVIVRDDLFMPNGIAVDPSGRGRIYWTDDSEGDGYKIESADTDGGNRRTELRGFYQSPMDLAFSPPTPEAPKGALYWSDWTSHAVWTLDLDDKDKGVRAMSFRGSHRDLPMGVLLKSSLTNRTAC
ncbi:protein cueball-like [Hetaerina americana]|uniref:protein cueball-like n=1 Tax=Hetaerina americana TaxID=62018 RepID=UPI003A7F24DD